jgi:hypothetical protein
MKACKKHPTYKAMRKPRQTSKHPLGCGHCWQLYQIAERARAKGTSK